MTTKIERLGDDEEGQIATQVGWTIGVFVVANDNDDND